MSERSLPDIGWGEPRAVRAVPSSPRSQLWLAEFADGTVVVKQVVGPDAAERFVRERTALRLAGRARPLVVPELLGTVDDDLVLVIENVTAHSGSTVDWPILYARALAQLHGATDAKDSDALPRLPGPGSADVEAFLRLAQRWAVDVPDAVRDELAALVDRLAHTDRYHLLHGDPCPDNAILTEDGVRFVDLEGAGFGSGMTELAYLHSGFPTCWCVTATPGPALAEAEAAYREIAGDFPALDLADACTGWLVRGDALVERARRGGVDHLDRLVRRDWRWGTASARERFLHRLRMVANLGADLPELVNTARLSRTLAERARYRWPDRGPLPTTGGNPLDVTRQ